MDLNFRREDRDFQNQVRRFVKENLPADIRDRIHRGAPYRKADAVTWQKILNVKGWGAPHWPKQWGGTGWTATQRYLFDEETAGECPPQSPFGLSMVAPVIYTFGNDSQKARYLPRILNADDWWCQGYSEPGSGSDLASLKTRAVADGDFYLVNGHKIWTTQAHEANMIFCLVRTNTETKPQLGISFLLIDMTTPGITVRPIITLDEGHTINEVFFDNVRVPRENLVGEEGKGWTYAKFLLGFERTGIAQVAHSKHRLAKLKEIAKAELCHGRPLIQDNDFRVKLSEVEIELMALEYTNLRILADSERGKTPGPEASMLKVRGSEIGQKLTELAVEALGNYAAPYDPAREGRNEPPIGPAYGEGLMRSFLYGRAYTIYGGSNEIQRNIIAKMVLGL